MRAKSRPKWRPCSPTATNPRGGGTSGRPKHLRPLGCSRGFGSRRPRQRPLATGPPGAAAASSSASVAPPARARNIIVAAARARAGIIKRKANRPRRRRLAPAARTVHVHGCARTHHWPSRSLGADNELTIGCLLLPSRFRVALQTFCTPKMSSCVQRPHQEVQLNSSQRLSRRQRELVH